VTSEPDTDLGGTLTSQFRGSQELSGFLRALLEGRRFDSLVDAPASDRERLGETETVLPAQNIAPLELHENCEDRQNELAGRTLRIDRLAPEVEDAKARAAVVDPFKTFDDSPEADCRARQTINLRHDKAIAAAQVIERLRSFHQRCVIVNVNLPLDIKSARTRCEA
jgi:hypothetical protein